MDNEPTFIDLQGIPKALTYHTASEIECLFMLDYEEGLVDALPLYAEAKFLEDTFKTIKDRLKSQAISEALDGLGVIGTDITVRRGGTQYEFAHDPKWNEYKLQEAKAKDARKSHETFMKNIDTEMVDPATGELVKPANDLGDRGPRLVIKFRDY